MHFPFHGVYETMWSVSDLKTVEWGTVIAGLVADVGMTHLDTQIKLFVRLVACSPPPPPQYQFLFLSFSYRHGVTTATQQSSTTCNDQTC